MKKNKFLTGILIFILGISIFNSCNKDKKDKTGFVTFGANYDIVNCISTVTIYIDNENIGTLNNPTNSIIDCGEESNITKELSIGEHSYNIEIRPENGTDGAGCMKDINGTFIVSENKCEKIFIDYLQVFGTQSDCDQNVIISETQYQSAPNAPLTITEMKIDGDCLKIKFSAIGCDGNTWTVKIN